MNYYLKTLESELVRKVFERYHDGDKVDSKKTIKDWFFLGFDGEEFQAQTDLLEEIDYKSIDYQVRCLIEEAEKAEESQESDRVNGWQEGQ